MKHKPRDKSTRHVSDTKRMRKHIITIDSDSPLIAPIQCPQIHMYCELQQSHGIWLLLLQFCGQECQTTCRVVRVRVALAPRNILPQGATHAYNSWSGMCTNVSGSCGPEFVGAEKQLPGEPIDEKCNSCTKESSVRVIACVLQGCVVKKNCNTPKKIVLQVFVYHKGEYSLCF